MRWNKIKSGYKISKCVTISKYWRHWGKYKIHKKCIIWRSQNTKQYARSIKKSTSCRNFILALFTWPNTITIIRESPISLLCQTYMLFLLPSFNGTRHSVLSAAFLLHVGRFKQKFHTIDLHFSWPILSLIFSGFHLVILFPYPLRFHKPYYVGTSYWYFQGVIY